MPYLDGAGGAGDSNRSSVVNLGGRIFAVSSAIRGALQKESLGHHVAVCTNTAGSELLPEVPVTKFEDTCLLTGQKFNRLFEESDMFYKDGTLGRVKLPYPEEFNGSVIQVYSQVEGSRKAVLTYTETPRFVCRGWDYIENDTNREAMGYKRLSLTHYPEDRSWKDRYDAAVEVDMHDQLILKTDAVEVVDTAGRIVFVHQQEVGPEWTKVHSFRRGVALYAAPGCQVVKTRKGRLVVPKAHAVAQMANGQWDFTRNLHGFYVWGRQVYADRGDDLATIRYQALCNMLDNSSVLTLAYKNMLEHHVSGYIRLHDKPLYHWGGTGYSFKDLVKAVEVTDYDSDNAKDLRRYGTRRLAEMEAIDYNLPAVQAEAPTTAIELPTDAVALPVAPMEGAAFPRAPMPPTAPIGEAPPALQPWPFAAMPILSAMPAPAPAMPEVQAPALPESDETPRLHLPTLPEMQTN